MNLKFIIGAASCGKTSLAQRICYDDTMLDNSVKLRYAEQIVEYSLRLKNNADNYLYLEFNDIERNEEKCLAYFAK